MVLLAVAVAAVLIFILARAWKNIPRPTPSGDAVTPDETGLAERGIGILSVYFLVLLVVLGLAYGLVDWSRLF